jgi:hypothetical protein
MIEPGDLGPTGGGIDHYTKASTALECILHSMTIRLGPVADTNDPWEGRRLTSGSLNKHAERVSEIGGALEQINRVLGAVRVACFCKDNEGAEPDKRSTLFAMSSLGWARDRMWAQYADGHRGLCLVFDRAKLVKSAQEALAERGAVIAEDVAYDDAASGGPTIDFDEVIDLGPQPYAETYRTRFVRDRYFTKRLDGQGEHEFRIALLGNDGQSDPVFSPIKGTLVAIVLGDRFSDAYRPCIQAICTRENIPAFHMRYSGFVTLSPYLCP